MFSMKQNEHITRKLCNNVSFVYELHIKRIMIQTRGQTEVSDVSYFLK